MKTVHAEKIECTPIGHLLTGKIKVTCGSCGYTFKDKPVIAKKMISKCPYCNTFNHLPITQN